MNSFDIVLLALAGFFFLVGVLKGMTRILLGLAALAGGIFLAGHFHRQLAARLGFLGMSEQARALACYVAILVGTLLVGGLVAFFMRKLLRAAMLTWLDRLAGGVLGLFAALVVAAVLVLPLVAYTDAGRRALSGSVSAPYVITVADLVNRFMPAGLSARYRRGVEELKRHWREDVVRRVPHASSRA